MAMAVKITQDLSTVTSCIDLSVRRIVTKSPKVGPPLIFFISLGDGRKQEGGGLGTHHGGL
jgi:hypothetical protein